MSGFQTISPAALMRLVGTADAPVMIDLRIAEDIAANPTIVPGAIVHDHREFDQLLKRLEGKASVAICHGGRKISHGIAARLRAAGLRSEVLQGGMEAWRAAGHPALPLAALPSRDDGSTLWVTRHRPKVDRIACPWLIRRFIDAQARFLYVPPAEVMDVAARFDATPFDAPGATYTHDGAECTFDRLIAAFGLSHPALDIVANVVRAADTDQINSVPQAAGLLAFSVGMSRLHRDDNAQLEAALPFYDALYRWARDGQDESHDSTGAGTS